MISYAPEEVLYASQMLSFTSGYLVSLGLKRVKSMENLWLYIYDEDIFAFQNILSSFKIS